jgi:hypothetical protein
MHLTLVQQVMVCLDPDCYFVSMFSVLICPKFNVLAYAMKSCQFKIFREHAGELRIIKLREGNSLKWTKVQCQKRQNTLSVQDEAFYESINPLA